MSEINLNQPETLKLLARIADALERLANNGQPTSPDMRRPIEEYASFDWPSIGASVVQSDRDGATLVEYGGFLWTRRSPANKFDPAIWFSRAAGKDAEGNVLYLRLLTFQTIKAPEALPEKARQVAHTEKSDEKAAFLTWATDKKFNLSIKAVEWLIGKVGSDLERARALVPILAEATATGIDSTAIAGYFQAGAFDPDKTRRIIRELKKG
jgi:hypothetical protein